MCFKTDRDKADSFYCPVNLACHFSRRKRETKARQTERDDTDRQNKSRLLVYIAQSTSDIIGEKDRHKETTEKGAETEIGTPRETQTKRTGRWPFRCENDRV